MAMNNPHESVNHIPFLSEEMERTLRLLAWKDEIFREALIADPKGIIQYLFHHHLPNGKLPNDLTINVIEQDASTHHIVLPAFADEEPILEIAEEEQLDLIVYLGALNGKRPRDSDESKQSHKAEYKEKKTFGYTQFKLMRDQAKEAEKLQEQTKEIKVPTEKELAKALSKAMREDEKIAQAVKDVLRTDRTLKNDTIRMLQDKNYLSGFEMPKDINYRVHQDAEGTYHLVLQSSRDASGVPELPQHGRRERSQTNGCDTNEQACRTRNIDCLD